MHEANVRRVQIAFLVMLAVSAAQLLWWVIDQSWRAEAGFERWREVYAADADAARRMLDLGAPAVEVAGRYPHLDVGSESVTVAAVTLEALDEERRGHVNQYVWEGAFFMVVLLGSMTVVWRAVRRDVQLRRWQENFLAAVTHELKSPLASLQLAAETLALRELGSERRKVLLDRILADAERLGGTVANVLDTHQLDLHAVRLERRPVSLCQAVAEAVAEIEYRARDAGVELSVEVPEGLTMAADPVAVRTVMRNLLDNALKATQDAGGRIQVSAGETADGVRLEVRDDGVGFAPQEAEQLFQKFYRVGDEMRRTQPGSGLGLYLTRGFAELDGGTVTASSDGLGRGAVFTVTWRREDEP